MRKIKPESPKKWTTAVEDLPVETSAAEPVLLFTNGTWAGRPQWRCAFCPWDTLESEAAMLEHYETVHKPPEPPKPEGLIMIGKK